MEPTTLQIAMPFLVVLAIASVAGVLIFGIAQMARGKNRPGETNIDRARRSNKLMQWRIILQALAIALFLLMLALR